MLNFSSQWELTHTDVKMWGNVYISWEFLYQAPSSVGNDTLYSVGNSTNYDGTPLGDQYNIGVDFYITVVDSVLDVKEVEQQPVSFALSQNYPNPFNPTTVISYQLKVRSFISLKVYNMLGGEVATLVDEKKEAGSYSVTFTPNNLPSGIYFYRLRGGEEVMTKKMVYVK